MGKIRRILVVDDDPLVCDCVLMLLTFAGFEVETAGGGQAAIEAFRKTAFDLVFTDYTMPEMKGDELAAALKALSPQLPVVIITGNAAMVAEPDKLPPGVDFLVGKPFMLEDLRSAIDRACSAVDSGQGAGHSAAVAGAAGALRQPAENPSAEFQDVKSSPSNLNLICPSDR